MRLAGCSLLLLACACHRSGEAAHVDLDAGVPLPRATVQTRAVGEACVTGDDCASGVCFHKRLKVPGAAPEQRDATEPLEMAGYCSTSCAVDGDCPVPPTSGRCGARGMCKRP